MIKHFRVDFPGEEDATVEEAKLLAAGCSCQCGNDANTVSFEHNYWYAKALCGQSWLLVDNPELLITCTEI